MIDGSSGKWAPKSKVRTNFSRSHRSITRKLNLNKENWLILIEIQPNSL